MKNMWREFKDFVNRGNLVTIAVAFVLGAAFKTVIDSITGTPENPGLVGGILGAIFGGDQPNFNDRGVTVNGSFIPIGGFLTALLNFLLVALVVFFIVKAYNAFKRSEEAGPSEIQLLTEIRDALRERND
jgi:large conductance mechanosensitive channel